MHRRTTYTTIHYSVKRGRACGIFQILLAPLARFTNVFRQSPRETRRIKYELSKVRGPKRSANFQCMGSRADARPAPAFGSTPMSLVQLARRPRDSLRPAVERQVERDVRADGCGNSCGVYSGNKIRSVGHFDACPDAVASGSDGRLRLMASNQMPAQDEHRSTATPCTENSPSVSASHFGQFIFDSSRFPWAIVENVS